MAFRTSIDVTVTISVPVADAKDPAAIMAAMKVIEDVASDIKTYENRAALDFGESRIVRSRVEVVALKQPTPNGAGNEDGLDIPPSLRRT